MSAAMNKLATRPHYLTMNFHSRTFIFDWLYGSGPASLDESKVNIAVPEGTSKPCPAGLVTY